MAFRQALEEGLTLERHVNLTVRQWMRDNVEGISKEHLLQILVIPYLLYSLEIGNMETIKHGLSYWYSGSLSKRNSGEK